MGAIGHEAWHVAFERELTLKHNGYTYVRGYDPTYEDPLLCHAVEKFGQIKGSGGGKDLFPPYCLQNTCAVFMGVCADGRDLLRVCGWGQQSSPLQPFGGMCGPVWRSKGSIPADWQIYIEHECFLSGEFEGAWPLRERTIREWLLKIRDDDGVGSFEGFVNLLLSRWRALSLYVKLCKDSDVFHAQCDIREELPTFPMLEPDVARRVNPLNLIWFMHHRIELLGSMCRLESMGKLNGPFSPLGFRFKHTLVGRDNYGPMERTSDLHRHVVDQLSCIGDEFFKPSALLMCLAKVAASRRVMWIGGGVECRVSVHWRLLEAFWREYTCTRRKAHLSSGFVHGFPSVYGRWRVAELSAFHGKDSVSNLLHVQRRDPLLYLVRIAAASSGRSVDMRFVMPGVWEQFPFVDTEEMVSKGGAPGRKTDNPLRVREVDKIGVGRVDRVREVLFGGGAEKRVTQTGFDNSFKNRDSGTSLKTETSKSRRSGKSKYKELEVVVVGACDGSVGSKRPPRGGSEVRPSKHVRFSDE